VVVVRDKNGKLQAPKSRRAYYQLAQWLKADGDNRKPKDASTGAGWQCDAYSCLSLVKGQLLSFIAKPDAIHDDCQRASIMVAPMDIRQSCPAPKIILDRGMLWEKGASTIAVTESGLVLTVASEKRGVRPWSPERRRKETIPANPADAPPMDEKAADNAQE
jgi:competence protein ComEC